MISHVTAQPPTRHPHILRTLLAALLDHVACGRHPPSILFQSCCGNPSGGVFRVGLNERVKEHTCPLDVTNPTVCLEHNAIERSEVNYGAYCRLQAGLTARTSNALVKEAVLTWSSIVSFSTGATRL